MNSSAVSSVERSVGVFAVATVLVGVGVFGYGLLLVPLSLLGGAWIAAIGAALALSGLFATAWVGDRLELSSSARRTLSLSFAVVAFLLFASFVAVNYASVESFAESA
ncbi:hypothetical protein [Halogeometricum sp. CBA1124]|uniref:hypothetical protein n=1 Tax=Halogeometricum sp. CBA1124 TaxID=2668071 RepID=UPI0018D21CBE|nr:hypothetical protein [Halogeometricum sp. CBA1124]